MRVSVVVPAYNAEGTLGRCLEALLAQDFPSGDYEVIVVDDGSRDGTSPVASRYPVRLFKAPHRGPGAARNRGAREARGELLLFTDADCEPAGDWVREMASAFRSEPALAGAKGAYASRQRELVARFAQLEYADRYRKMRRSRYIDFVDTYAAAYRRDVFLAYGGFDEALPVCEDQELSFRLGEEGYKMAFLPGAIVYHWHAASLGQYMARKFRIAYWKVQVIFRHPGKALQDSYTPPSLKIEAAIAPFILLSLALLPFWHWAGVVALGLGGLFLAAAAPFIVFSLRGDPGVGLVSPLFLLGRALGLAGGWAVGVANLVWEGLKNLSAKRAMDILGALLGLGLAGLAMAVIACLIKLDSAGPVLFSQLRAGKGGRPFRLYKFRSMVAGAEEMLGQLVRIEELAPPVFKLKGDPRVTRLGRVLRRFSLDELPQLFNVLKGEMSLVGPRPEEVRLVERYDQWARLRLEVKPGMTGPMQVSGRADLTLEERVRLEVDYIEQQSLWRDMVILWKTIPAVLRGRGSY